MNRRINIPPGKAGLIVLAAALAPVAIRKLKPVAKAIGQGMMKAGEALLKSAEEPHAPEKTEKAASPSAPKAPPKRKPAAKRAIQRHPSYAEPSNPA